jgi:predicted GNAT superfamily acetyltransferase
MKDGGRVARLEFREIKTNEEFDAVVALQEAVWGGKEATPRNQLIANCRHGGVLVGAFDDAGRLVGFAFGFPGFDGRKTWLCSHMLAVLPEMRGRDVGKQLKFFQRDVALRMGYREMTWTFDPLEARNASLNLNALGATVSTYIEDCYGPMEDDLNRGMPSDRLEALWRLDEGPPSWPPVLPDAPRAETGEEAEEVLLVPFPRDIQGIKKTDMERALWERLRLRRILPVLFERGYVLTGVHPVSDVEVAYVARRLS